MGILDNIFNNDKKKPSGSNNNNQNNNPLANMRRNIEQTMNNVGKPRTMGPGQSLGGSKPGMVIKILIEQPGPVGIRVEKQSNNSKGAIVHTVVEGSQAEAAGLRRGDVLCFAGSNGQEEMPYEMFLEIAKSPQRPIHLEARRFEPTKHGGAANPSTGSADAEARRRAMIAAAERRNKQHKAQTKTIKHVTKSTLLKQQQQQELEAASAGPQTEESRRAAEAAKRGESQTVAQLGYNPYEAIKKTAGQARAATTTVQHGAISAPGSSAPTPPPAAVAPPVDLDAFAETENDDVEAFHDFEVALATVVSSPDPAAAKNGLKIARKLTVNATTKGQQANGDAEKFRRVRLANAKIKAAIADVPGNLDVMMAVGFALVPDDTQAGGGESLLVYPPGTKGPSWLPRALKAMEMAENGINATSSV